MNTINLYCADTREWSLSTLERLLSQKEVEDLSVIRHEMTFKQKAVSRALLRHTLKTYYGLLDNHLVFEYNERGKPFLKHYPQICFNNSHSMHKILFGITANDLIGVDLEFVKPFANEEAIAKQFFSIREYAHYQEYKHLDGRAFFKFWTAKEAIIKALGKAIWEVNQVPEICLHEGEFCLRFGSKILTDWILSFPPVDNSYVACVAVNCHKLSKTMYIWHLKNQI